MTKISDLSIVTISSGGGPDAVSSTYFPVETGGSTTRRVNVLTFLTTLPSRLRGLDGSVLDPAFSFTNDTDTGMYREAADPNTIKFSTGGVLSTRITATGIDLIDGVTAPSTVAGRAQLYVDTADGDLKIKYGDGTVKTIVVDT